MPYKDRFYAYQHNREYNKREYHKRRDAWLYEHGPCIDCGSWKDLRVSPRGKITYNLRVFMKTAAKREPILAKCVVRCDRCCRLRTMTIQKKRPFPRTKDGHGLWRYRKGCRCDYCKSCKSIANARLRADSKARYQAKKKAAIIENAG